MEYRRLGKSSLVVSAMGLGCMSMSQSYGAVTDEAESIATLYHAIDRGITFFDTANVYGAGENEELLGRTLAKRRNEVVIATKFGHLPNPDGSLRVNGRPEQAQQQCDASLRRLHISTIDLYYLHRVDPTVPIEETIGGMARLVEQGKVRYLGLSEAGEKTVRRAHATYPIAALQSEYALWTRDPEDGVLAACRELGIGFVPFSPLGRGFFSGQIRQSEFETKDFRANFPRFQTGNLETNLQIVDRLEQLAAGKGCTSAQIALAWVLSQGNDIVPIPGTKRRKYLDENLGALKVKLTSADLKRIEEVAPRTSFAGPRYPEAHMKRVGL